MRRIKRVRKGVAEMMRAKKDTFGELITADNLIRRDAAGSPEYDPGEELLEGAQNALVISDSCTEFLGVYPQGTKSKEETERSIRHYQGYNVIQSMYCDSAGELSRQLWVTPTL